MAGRGRDFILPAWKTNPDLPSNQAVPTGVGTAPPNAVGGFPRTGPPTPVPPTGVVGGTLPASVSAPRVIGPWTEHTTSDGRKYYYNSATKQSTYEKPEEFKTNIEKSLPICPWREYVKNGKSYFFNSQTNASVWEEPMEFTQYKERLTALCTGDLPSKDVSSQELYKAARKALEDCIVDSDGTGAQRKIEQIEAMEAAAREKKRVKSAEELELQVVSGELKAPSEKKKNEPQFTKDEDAIEAFKQLLSDKNVPANATWLEAMGYGIANDPRFKALKSLKKKKEALLDYANWKKTADEHQQKEKLEKSKIGLKNILQMYAKGEKKPQITGRTRMSEVIEILELEDVYSNFGDKEERDLIVKDFLDHLYAEEKTKLAETRRKLFKEAKTALYEIAEQKGIDAKKSWSADMLKQMKSSSDERIKAIEAIDWPDLWKEFMIDYKERERKRRIARERELKEKRKIARLDFYEWILAELRHGNYRLTKPLFSRKNLVGIEEEIKNQKFFKKLLDLDDLKGAEGEYDAVVRKVMREVEPCRKSLKKVFKRGKIRLLEELSWEDVLQKYSDTRIEGPDGETHLLKDKIAEVVGEFGTAKCKNALYVIQDDYIKRLERKKDEFEDLLWDVIYKSDHIDMPWEKAKDRIKEEEEYLALPDEETRKEVFKKYMKKFKARKEKKRLAQQSGKKDKEDRENVAHKRNGSQNSSENRKRTRSMESRQSEGSDDAKLKKKKKSKKRK